MDSNSWIEYKIQVRERIKVFALNILELSSSLPTSERARILNRQITRSGTSTYSNYRAALRARSKAEFFAKLSVTVEEADETEMWLDLIIDSKISVSELAIQLHAESVEIIKILATMRKRLK
ncbi:four helix bundle protein [uncultured Draconibacterium sp.]|uniref:four helix bundle protein n=1 Tax=uncultured Draconibacterium sp. TaxID=1573823 RepID=UPI003217C66E